MTFIVYIIMYNHELKQQILQIVAKRTKDIYSKCYFSKFNKQPDFSHTVLCSISLYNNLTDKLQIASLGFGTKSLPYNVASQNKGMVIKDMHAEILAKRGFIKYLIKQKPIKNNENQLFKWDNLKEKHELKSEIQVIMFVNEVFCGDCMINKQQNIFSGAKPLKYFADKQIPQDKFTQYCLRIKPGRLDLPLQKRSLSLSCSDKLGVWNILGIQGKKLFNFFKPIYINKIVIETQHNLNTQRIKQGIDFKYRLSKLFGFSDEKIDIKLFKIVVEGKKKYITTQFRFNYPQIILNKTLKIVKENEKEQIKNQKQKQGKFQLCGIFSCDQISWLSGKTGLPEGVNLKKINKVSPFCSEKLYQNLQLIENDQFKYHAVKERIKLLFGEWTDQYKK